MLFAGSTGGGVESDASDLDPAAENACARLSGGGRRETAVGKSKAAAAARICSGSRTWHLGHGLGVPGAAGGL
jgi:hypothetical protein